MLCYYMELFPRQMLNLSMIKLYVRTGFNISKFLIKRTYRHIKSRITEYFNNNIIHLSNGNMVICYNRRGKEYKILLEDELVKKHINSPSSILMVYDEDSNDVSDDVIPYMGWKNDFHKLKYTPTMLGYKSLSFELTSGTMLVFKENEIIEFGILIL